MQANSPAKIDTTPGQAGPAIDYARALDELLQLYTRIDLAAGALRIVDVPIMRGIVDVPIILAAKRTTPTFLGEWLAFISIRPLITRVLHWHFHHRLRALVGIYCWRPPFPKILRRLRLPGSTAQLISGRSTLPLG